MRRRDFLRAAGAAVAAEAAGARAILSATSAASPASAAVSVAEPSLLLPMDDAQSNHLKAYGVTFRVLKRGGRAEWLLNYRGGSFLLPADAATERDAALAGVTVEPASDGDVVAVRGEIQANNMDAVPLEKAPKVAVYVPPNAAPWDDAVTMSLEYAGIEYEKIWDPEVVAGRLKDFEWLHLHHEDFTGQYSKFYINYAGSAWLQEAVQQQEAIARQFSKPSVPALKKAVAEEIRKYVEGGGFLFAMCTATETIEQALAAVGVDIAAAFSDGTGIDADASGRMQWERTLAFRDAEVQVNPGVSAFSDIDGHQVNTPWRQPLGAFTLFDFSPKFDPVPSMLVQNHEAVIPDFYGLTTSFRRDRLKPGVVVLAEEEGTGFVKYIHGNYGKGTFTFLGGHDPEDPQHQIGDSPTDLNRHPHSPGFRLILNNVLFPAAKKKTLKTD